MSELITVTTVERSHQTEIVAEHFERIGDLPVMTCVLETAGGFFIVGYAARGRDMFDAEREAGAAKRAAYVNLDRMNKGRLIR